MIGGNHSIDNGEGVKLMSPFFDPRKLINLNKERKNSGVVRLPPPTSSNQNARPPVPQVEVE